MEGVYLIFEAGVEVDVLLGAGGLGRRRLVIRRVGSFLVRTPVVEVVLKVGVTFWVMRA
jgi:hypothetical protein